MEKTISAEEAQSQFERDITGSPWGSISKIQLETLVFKFLVDCGKININDSDFDLSNNLQTTTTAVRKLKYRYYQQRDGSLNELNISSIMKTAEINFEDASQGYVSVEIENTYLLEYLRQRLREQSAVPRILSSTILLVKQEALIKVLAAEARKTSSNRGAVDTNIKALRILFNERASIETVRERLKNAGTAVSGLNSWADLISNVISGAVALGGLL